MARAPQSLHESAPARRSSVVRLHVPFSGDDAALVRAVRDGNAAAKAELFHRYAAQLERLITHVLGYDAELADILQETFVAALRSLGSLKDPAALKPWLLTIATLTARKALRSRSRRRWLRYFTDETEEARYEPQVEPPNEESQRAAREVYAILARFPVDERLAFALRYINGLDLTAVASACDVSLATIKRRLQRADRRFVKAAAGAPALADWIESGERWKSR
ncbi:MAG TPA: RNA polymerase sigma factor [Polyangiaceae bacterium]|nr:RNA polymerase sigma factor [Polyangiaceae bacterium]